MMISTQHRHIAPVPPFGDARRRWFAELEDRLRADQFAVAAREREAGLDDAELGERLDRDRDALLARLRLALRDNGMAARWAA